MRVTLFQILDYPYLIEVRGDAPHSQFWSLFNGGEVLDYFYGYSGDMVSTPIGIVVEDFQILRAVGPCSDVKPVNIPL